MAMFEPRLHRVPRPRPDRRRAGRGRRDRCAPRDARCSSSAAGVRYSGAGREALALRRGARRPGRRDASPAARSCRTTTRCTAAPLGIVGSTSANALAAEADVVARRRHPAPGLHHLVVDRLRRRTSGSSRSTPPASTRSSTAPRRSSATRARRWSSSTRRWATGPRRRGLGRRAAAEAADWDAHIDRSARGVTAGRHADLRPGDRCRQRRQRSRRLRADRVRRHAGRAARRLAHRRGQARRGPTSGATMDLEYGFSCMGYEVVAPWGAAMARARTHPDGAGHLDLRRRLLPDAQLRALLRGVRRPSRTSPCSATTPATP